MTWLKTNRDGICESTSPDLPEEFIYSLNSLLTPFFWLALQFYTSRSVSSCILLLK
jgi:hypothetical protein